MKIEHNSRLSIYRTPFGAVTSGTKVKLRLGICDGGIPESIRVIYRFKDMEEHLNMSYIYEVGECCIYEAELTMPNDVGNLWYYFEIVNSNGRIYYANNSRRLGGIGEICNSVPENLYQITVYSPDFKTPDWFKNSVVYQIFPDRFYKENEEFLSERQDIIKRNWGEVPFYKAEQFGGEYLANDFFGGNIKGIIKKLPFLCELGINAIYLNPVFKAYSNHKYDTGNYMEIDSSFGTNEEFGLLCQKAEELGIRIILDGVFNHTGSNSIYFNKNGEYEEVGAYQSKESEYYDWYNFIEWPDDYQSWWGIKSLPGVNESSKSYRDYILNNENSVVKHWLKEGASGWRLDVVDELPGFFVKELRKAVKSVNEDAVIIGEVWEDASNKCSYGEEREYFLGYELDSVMNYPLRSALIDIAKGNINAEEFDMRIMSIKENYPMPAYYSLLNFLSTHDVERIVTILSSAPDKNTVSKDFMAEFKLSCEEYQTAIKKVKQVIANLMLMPGVPCIYYGDEIGMQGYADPFCRQCYDWENGNKDMMNWYKTIISLRRSAKEFIDGEFENVYKYNQGYAFIRRLKDDMHLVCSNFSDNNECFRIDIGRFGIKRIDNRLCDEVYSSDDGIYYINMAPRETKVFKGLI